MGKETVSQPSGVTDVWASFRLQVIGGLLQHPPVHRGERRARLRELAEQSWTHPLSGARVRLGFSTIARWYDAARKATDPVQRLGRAVRCDRGRLRVLDAPMVEALRSLHVQHPEWSVQLIYDNLCAMLRRGSGHGGTPPALPSYQTVRRFMRAAGLHRRRRLDRSGTQRARDAEHRFVAREVDHYECSHVGELVHWDFHEGSWAVRDPVRGLCRPKLLAFLDDRSRLVLHAQWYLAETAQVVAHALMQALAKYGLPRAVINDNGSAMRADEIRQGLDRLGIVHHFTQVHSPYQNGKMESFWGQVEGRLLAMVRDRPAVELAQLNRLTAAWLAEDYHRRSHAITGEAPLARFTAGPTAMRPPWPWARLELAFTVRRLRRVRPQVGVVSVHGVLFALPSAYRDLRSVTVHAARWDRSRAFLMDPRTDALLAVLAPADPQARADGRRCARVPPDAPVAQASAKGPAPVKDPVGDRAQDLPPLLAELLDSFDATGLPLGILAPPTPLVRGAPASAHRPSTNPAAGA
jgi:transposase InsO family protein